METCFQSVSDAFLLPKIIQLDHNLFAAAFKLMKLIPAKYMLNKAIERGDIKQGYTVVETSSGTFALGIGIVCAELKLPFKIFSDPVIDEELVNRLEGLGGTVHISRNAEKKGAYQKMRLTALNEYLVQNPLSYWVQQYDNPDNPHSYHIVSKQLLTMLGKEINIVGAVGSGGSTGGIITGIRTINPKAKLIGVDTFNSVLFGLPDGGRDLRGLGNSITPKNLNHSLYDEIHWICANDAHHHTQLLHQQKSLFYGPTTGATYQVAKYLAQINPQEKYVFLAADEGYRYGRSVFNPTWFKNQPDFSPTITQQPIKVSSPLAVATPWCYMEWNRRKNIYE